jgi:hypothetical protein
MSKRALQALFAVLAITIAVAIAGAASPSGHARGISYDSLLPIQKKLVSGALQMGLSFSQPSGNAAIHAATTAGCGTGQSGGDEPDEADNACPPDSFAPAPGPGGGPGGSQNYAPSGNNGCDENQGDNVKVNQNCENVSDPDLAGRGQAQNEESISVDPNNQNHVVASQNDYRRGDGNCYAAYSLDGGKSWSDSTVPMGFTRGTLWSKARQYWQAGGDTSVAWDTKGNAYISCQMFNRGSGVTSNPDQSSAFYVFRSTQNDGASWNFPGRPTTEFNDTAGTGAVLEDKALIAVDDTVGSPFQDRIYVSWTEFAADGSAYIYEVHSNDYGQTFSPRVLVSKNSPLCTLTYGAGTPNGNCNENQFSDPFVGPDGALYVAYSNFNNSTAAGAGPDNHYQMLLSKSTDGGQTFSAPVLVSNYYDLPDCPAYQGSDPGRACVPEKGPTSLSVFRATNYAAGAVNPKNASQVAVTFGSYINQHSNETNGCTPAGFSAFGNPLYTGVKSPGGCNNDILVSVSNNGGASFTGTTTDPRTETSVNQDPDQAKSDQWFQWAAFTKDGKLAVDYYDRQYGKSMGSPAVPGDEWTGNSDITLSGSKDLVKFGSRRVTSSSMPPPTQFPDAHGGGQFFGDYIWLDTANNDALPIWSDTRDPELFTCPGTGTPTTPPAICTGVYPNGLTGSDENTYMERGPVPNK